MIYIDDSEPEGELEPVFPYRDVTIKRNVDANGLYDILSEVGRGKFGTVFKCQEKSTGLKLAAKFVPIPKREDRRNVEREVEIMNSLQHHLIIQLYAAYEYQKMMCVVLELIEGGELFDRVVDDEFVLTEGACVVFIRQLCEAMEFIHGNNILHLDLKPENILCLTQEGNRIKLIDFGLARKYDPNKRLQILFGTPEFVAPEVVNFDCISYATDMWSVGVICYVLISGLSPFMGETDIETMANVTIAKYDFEDEAFSNVSPDCIDFIGKLLVKDLSVRMTAAQCLKHKWLQRRPKASPLLTPKPLNVPAQKLKAPTPSPIPPNSDNEDMGGDEDESEDDVVVEHKELDSTKDNLKNFIERWEEHPNSPYVFDVEANVIAPLNDKMPARYKDSLSSSRVCSPSPCESIETVADDDEVFIDNAKIKINIIEEESSASNVTTPVNESREKLFPNCANHESAAGASSGRTTPTTPQQFATQYAPAHLYGGNNRPESLNASSTNLQQRSIKSYLHTFDRRNSDTNYLLGRRPSSERVNLADEIRKLSDHLMMLAEINNKLGVDTAPKKPSTLNRASDNNNTSAKTKAKSPTTATATKSPIRDENGKKIKTNSIKQNSNSNASTDAAAKPSAVPATTPTKGAASSTTLNGGRTKKSTLSIQRLQQSIEETPKLINGSNFLPWTKTIKKSTNNTMNASNAKASSPQPSSTASSTINKVATSPAKETATTRRAKFRVNHKSRDVPIGVPDTHHAVNLEEAATTTKDCLLHLLEKYNESKCRNPLTRHQSISADWNMRDNLEYRSMSSINAFFQRHNNTGERVKQVRQQLQKAGNAQARNNNINVAK